jgi:hypothetical protein
VKIPMAAKIDDMHKLVPELVPEPLWGVSAYRVLGKSTPWKAIRQDTLNKASNRCQFCESEGPQLACHDKWEYDDRKCIATLIGFEIRCPLCHLATHIGRAMRIGHLREAVEHICRVNACTVKNVEKMIDAEMPLWKKRSKKKWNVVVAPLLLQRYPRLQAVPVMTAGRS